MGVNNIPNKEYGSMSNSKIYQVNYHDGDGWQAIDEAAIKQRVGQSWDYLCWCFERGETAAVRHVEYRLVSGEQICIKVTRKGGCFTTLAIRAKLATYSICRLPEIGLFNSLNSIPAAR